MMTLTEAEEIFIGPKDPGDRSWLLPTYLQPGYGSDYIEGGFPAETFTPAWIESKPNTSWLTGLTKPFAEFGQSLFEASGKTVQAQYERLPDLLWGWGLERAGITEKPKEVKKDEGAGVKITHTQPAHAGGEPAQPIAITIPQMAAAAPGAPQAKEIGASGLLIGAGLLFLIILLRK